MSPRVVRVLLIEDNPHVASLIQEGLEGTARRELGGRVSFVFVHVPDGQSALAKLKELGDLQPDVIVCDVYMPVMDGTTFLAHLRASGGPQPPVIALSAGGEAAREAAMAAGADAFLDKPIRLQELLATFQRVLPA
jgi:CheY-like chemotaxis protein